MDEIREALKDAREGNVDGKLKLIELLEPIRKAMTAKYSKHGCKEDDEQDLIVLLLNSIESYKEEYSSFQWYVRELSRYHMLDKLKGLETVSADETSSDGFTLLDSLVDEKADTENLLLHREMGSILGENLDSLSSLHSNIVRLKFYSGCTGKEIAKFLGISEGTVSKELNKALKKLRRKLNDYRQETY